MRCCGFYQSSQTRRERGFTLLELMVAIVIFAVLGLMSSQLLNNMIRQHDIIDVRGERLMDLQRAMTILQRDINQIWGRGVRDAYGDPLGALMTDVDYPLEFTRTGWRNPLEHQRSELQRVAYEHRETTLYRYYWPVLDRAIDSEPVEQKLMENVLAVEFEPLDGYGDAFVPANAEANPTDLRLQLAALSVRFEFDGYGEVTRLWEVPASLQKNPSASGQGSGVPGELADDLENPEEAGGNAAGNANNRANNPDRGGDVRADPQDGETR